MTDEEIIEAMTKAWCIAVKSDAGGMRAAFAIANTRIRDRCAEEVKELGKPPNNQTYGWSDFWEGYHVALRRIDTTIRQPKV